METGKTFEPTDIQVILFEKNDVITTSGETPPPVETPKLVNTGYEHAF